MASLTADPTLSGRPAAAMSPAKEASTQASPAQQSQQAAILISTTKASRRREKPHLSCTLCRKRKLRCDRKQPCSSCASRDIACSYVQGRNGAVAPSLHDRLVQLERLIMLQMPLSQKATPTTSTGGMHTTAPQVFIGPTLADTSDLPSESGSLHVGGSELRYVGGGHWAAILDNIIDLKTELNQEDDMMLFEPEGASRSEHAVELDSVRISSGRRALLLYGCPRPASRGEILAALPPRITVDRYLSRYFTCLELISCTIHGPTFLQEYEAFWEDQSQVSMIWIGLLFGIMCLAVTTSEVSEAISGYERDQALRRVDLYVERIVQCMVLGQYTMTGPYVAESLVHYLHIEFAICTDASKDVWFLLALTIKIAMSMGHHRDPSHFPKLTPLQAEMRRRLCATLIQADVLISSQMGMPRMISDSWWDTAEPQNLNDSDLYTGMAHVPAARPETELTTSLGIIARIRMLKAVGKIADLTSTVTPCGYSEITRLDGLLKVAQATIPQLLQPKPLAASVTDSPQVIMARLFISQIFYKGQIMLHRRFLYLEPPPHEQASYTRSRKACLNAAPGLLGIQRIMDEETCPAGQLHMMRWRLSSLLNHEFLTATMLLCSLLCRGITLNRDKEIIAALQNSRDIWMRKSGESREARKAAATASIVLSRALGEDGKNPPGLQLGVAVTDANMKSLSWPTQRPLENLDTELDFDPSQMLEELVRPNAGVFFQPDLFEEYVAPVMHGQGLSMISNVQETPVPNPEMGEWML